MFSIPSAILIVIDIQGHLALAMHNAKNLSARVALCIKAANVLDLPVLYTEQAPQKLGRSIPAITALLKDLTPIEKSSFSCWGSPDFVQRLRASGRREIIIAGIEAHVCVFQTVADLLSENFKVQVVTDAVSARTEADKILAFNRMQDLGAELTSTEMLVTELMRTADHKNFREVLDLIK